MMAKRIYGYIMRIIHSLTDDEDIQQELWLYVLEGNSPFTLQTQYNHIVAKRETYNGFKETF